MSEIDEKVGKVVDPEPAPEPVAAPPAPSPEQVEAVAKSWLKEKHGIEDPAEIESYRTRARQADEYERVLRQPPRPYVQPPPHAPQGPAAGQVTREEWQELEQLGRINPAAATLRIMAIREAEREARDSQRMQQHTQQTVALITAATAYQQTESEAEKYCRTEFPDIYDQRTKLYREGQRVYDSMPELRGRGDGFKIAAQIAAANLGELPRSKRQSPAASRAEVEAQSPERGTKRPTVDADDSPPTAREKRIAAQMGIDVKKFRARRRELAESEKGK